VIPAAGGPAVRVVESPARLDVRSLGSYNGRNALVEVRFPGAHGSQVRWSGRMGRESTC